MLEVTICLIVKGHPPDQVLLGWKKTGLGRGKYTGLGGKLEPGETPVQATIREADEEAGIKIESHDLAYLGRLSFRFPARPEWDELAHVFLVSKWRGDPLETTEMKPIWFAFGEIPYEQMWGDYRYWLPRALAGRGVNARFVYSRDNERVESWESDWR